MSGGGDHVKVEAAAASSERARLEKMEEYVIEMLQWQKKQEEKREKRERRRQEGESSIERSNTIASDQGQDRGGWSC